MDLREGLPSDRGSVRDVHLRAFGDHGPADHGLVVASLVDTLRETITPTDGLSLVAEPDGQIVGHVMFTCSLLDAPSGCGQGFRKPSLRIPDGAFQASKLPEYEPWMTGTLV